MADEGQVVEDISGVSVADLDPRQVAAMDQPYDLLNELRERCPVSHSDTYGGFWNLFRYGDVCAAAVDPATFSSRDVTIPSEPLAQQIGPIMVDPPVHRDYRHPLLSRFSPSAVAGLEAAIRTKVGELIDGFIEDGHADLVNNLFLPFPAFAALKLLNLPEADFDLFSRWATLAFTIPEEGTADSNWGEEAAAYYGRLYDEAAGSDSDDLLSIARRIQIGGCEIQRMEYVGLLLTLVNAGLDTTTNAAANMALLLDDRPDLRRRLIDDPELIPRAVEEFLRYLSPLPMLSRVTNRDVTVGTGADAVTIPRGEKVALHWLAANHDPAEFDDPEQVVLERKPNRHVAFGLGPHRCIGIHLARIELRVVLEELLTRLPDYAVLRGEFVRGPGVTRQVSSLPVTFSPGPRSTA